MSAPHEDSLVSITDFLTLMCQRAGICAVHRLAPLTDLVFEQDVYGPTSNPIGASAPDCALVASTALELHIRPSMSQLRFEELHHSQLTMNNLLRAALCLSPAPAACIVSRFLGVAVV